MPIVLAPFLYNIAADDGIFEIALTDEQNSRSKDPVALKSLGMDINSSTGGVLNSATNFNNVTSAVTKTIANSLPIQIQVPLR